MLADRIDKLEHEVTEKGNRIDELGEEVAEKNERTEIHWQVLPPRSHTRPTGEAVKTITVTVY
jgi:hypothetical protein